MLERSSKVNRKVRIIVNINIRVTNTTANKTFAVGLDRAGTSGILCGNLGRPRIKP